jgi:hypothetical protein
MKKILQPLMCIFVVCFFSRIGFAHSSIAVVNGYFPATFSVTYNYKSQKEADHDSLEGCRTNARTAGLADRANKCSVLARGKGPGYGAATCGDNGCSWVASYSDRQEAIDAAYDACSKNYSNCKQDNIQNWADFVGFPSTEVATPASESCRPRTSNVTCQSQCVNGNCTVTYSNGCKMRVQLQPHFNPFNNQWEYPAPSC